MGKIEVPLLLSFLVCMICIIAVVSQNDDEDESWPRSSQESSMENNGKGNQAPMPESNITGRGWMAGGRRGGGSGIQRRQMRRPRGRRSIFDEDNAEDDAGEDHVRLARWGGSRRRGGGSSSKSRSKLARGGSRIKGRSFDENESEGNTAPALAPDAKAKMAEDEEARGFWRKKRKQRYRIGGRSFDDNDTEEETGQDAGKGDKKETVPNKNGTTAEAVATGKKEEVPGNTEGNGTGTDTGNEETGEMEVEETTPFVYVAPTENDTGIVDGGIPCEIMEEEADKEGDETKPPPQTWNLLNIFVSKEYTAEHIKMLNQTLNIFREAAPCLPINLLVEGTDERPTEGDYLDLDHDEEKGSYSYVGKVKSGGQMIGLPPSKISPFTISHQMMHALGFGHEQNRPDRDDYVEILWHNIWPGKSDNYVKKKNGWAIGPYDFKSIMHFKPVGFTIQGPTMISKKGEPLGNEDGSMTDMDKEKIRLLYCPDGKGKKGGCKTRIGEENVVAKNETEVSVAVDLKPEENGNGVEEETAVEPAK